jgi:biopolymer transport protein ExbD
MASRYTRSRRFQTIALGSAMADIAMLLLIFFMTSTTTDPPKTIAIQLPKATTSGVENEIFYLSLDTDGAIHYHDDKIQEDELKVLLMEKQGAEDRRVNISADKRLAFEKVDRILNILQDKGFLNIAFMAEPKHQ